MSTRNDEAVREFPSRCFDTCETPADCMMDGCKKKYPGDVKVKEVDSSKAALPVKDGDVLLIAPSHDSSIPAWEEECLLEG